MGSRGGWVPRIQDEITPWDMTREISSYRFRTAPSKSILWMKILARKYNVAAVHQHGATTYSRLSPPLSSLQDGLVEWDVSRVNGGGGVGGKSDEQREARPIQRLIAPGCNRLHKSSFAPPPNLSKVNQSPDHGPARGMPSKDVPHL